MSADEKTTVLERVEASPGHRRKIMAELGAIMRKQPVEIKIQCPHHKQEENITIPEWNDGDFAGEVHCHPDEGRAPRRVQI